MSDCTHDCSSCSKDCKERKETQKPQLNKFSKVKKLYVVMSAKGGVGKSMVTAQLAVLSRRLGKSVAVLDADITGASMTKYFGINEKAVGTDKGILPAVSATGIKLVSMSMFLQDEESPVVWRASLSTGAVTQFWTDVFWGDVDIMFIDMPPGTGDISLTVYQNLPIDGIIIVTTPQELVSRIVSRGVRMAEMLNIPIVAIVENMSYYQCGDCGTKTSIFGASNVEYTASKVGIQSVARIPISTMLTTACDNGAIEYFEGDWLEEIVKGL